MNLNKLFLLTMADREIIDFEAVNTKAPCESEYQNYIRLTETMKHAYSRVINALDKLKEVTCFEFNEFTFELDMQEDPGFEILDYISRQGFNIEPYIRLEKDFDGSFYFQVELGERGVFCICLEGQNGLLEKIFLEFTPELMLDEQDEAVPYDFIDTDISQVVETELKEMFGMKIRSEQVVVDVSGNKVSVSKEDEQGDLYEEYTIRILDSKAHQFVVLDSEENEIYSSTDLDL